MAKRLLMMVLFFYTVTGFGQTMNFEWVKQLQGGGYEAGYFIKIMDDGSVISTGYFNNTTDFDPGPGVYTLNTAGGIDVYVCKHDSSGNLIWARDIGGYEEEYPGGLDFDDNGNVYVSGYTASDSMDADPSPATHYLYQPSAPLNNGFLVKLDPSGNFVWANNILSTYQSAFTTIAVEGNAIYTTGSCLATTDLDPGPSTLSYTAFGTVYYPDLFVAKYSTAGNLIWCKTIGGNGPDGFSTVKYKDGTIFLGGEFSDTVDFDPGPGTYYQYSTYGYNAFALNLDTSGNFNWVKSIGGFIPTGGTLYIFMGDIEVDDTGSIYLSGIFQGDLDAGVTILSNNIPTDISVFLMKLNPAREVLFAKQIGEAGNSVGGAIMVLDQYANIYLAGTTEDSLDVDPGPGTDYLQVSGTYNTYICRLDSAGNYIQSHRFTTTSGHNGASDMAIGPDQSIYITGDFESTTDFDPDLFMVNLTSAGNTDAYIQKMKTTYIVPPSGLPDYKKEIQVNIYPNPSSENITIHSAEVLDGMVTIYNDHGEIVMSTNWLSGSTQMNVPVLLLLTGTYFVTFMDRNGNGFTRPLIKN